MSGPQLENGYLKLANEIAEALMRTNLSPYESRFLWCVFRHTYGFNKKDDWIALSMIAEKTGMRRPHVSRAKAKLIERNIVTQTGNRIAFNKHYTQWRELPKLVTVTQTGNHEQQGASGGTSSGNEVVPDLVTEVVPVQGPTKDNLTKDTSTKHSSAGKADETDLDRAITKHLKSLGIDHPHAYLLSIKRKTKNNVAAIEKAWREWKSGGISSRGQFYDRCLHHAGVKKAD